MTTFIFIVGVLLRVIPMVAVLWLIWHVSRKPIATGLLRDREAKYWWPPERLPAAEETKRPARLVRPPLATAGKSTRRPRVLAQASTPRASG
jgi:hypothetical protein